MQLQSNTLLQNGKYRIIRVLGQGGFGITYLAENILLAKKIAIKEFFPKDFCGRDNTSHLTLGTQNNAETVDKLKTRFIKEAQNIAKLDHPGIVKIHDVFEENNTAYYVMDYIEGENLNEMVKRNGPLSEAKAVEYIRKVGDALDYIHSHNMTHFDVKPANIVVRQSDDYPILLDFGLSKQYNMQGGATSTLMQGISNGYSPIELYNPGSLATFSPQTDVYSLGATFYFLITGKIPPSASELCSGMETLYIDSSHSSSIREAITKAMTTNRTHRPSSIYQLINSIELPSSITSSTKETTSYVNDEETMFVSPRPYSKNESRSPIPPHTSNYSSSSHSIMSWGWAFGMLITVVIITFSATSCPTNTHNVRYYKPHSPVDETPSTNTTIEIPETLDYDHIFNTVEQQAEFPGGTAALMKWLNQNIRYPEQAAANDIQGRVIVQFVVEKDGAIGATKILKGVDKDLDYEVLRVAKEMPKWQPGKNNGVTVRSYFSLPVNFKLQDSAAL